MKIINLKIINLEWLLMHDHINIYIPILLFDEEHFKKRIRFLTIFWKKMSVFNFFKIIKKNIFRCRQIFFQNIARNLILFLKCSSSKSRIGMCVMIWSCITNHSKLMIFKLMIFIYLKIPIWRGYFWGIKILILYYYSTVCWDIFQTKN